MAFAGAVAYAQVIYQPGHLAVPSRKDVHNVQVMVEMNYKGASYRLLTPADVGPAADILSRAFMEDPLCAFLMPCREMRLATFQAFFRTYSRMNTSQRRGFGAGDPLQGVAYWKFPGQRGNRLSASYVAAHLPLIFTPYPIAYFRLRAISRKIHSLREKYAAQPHFYLDYIGVVESARGRGIASTLMVPVLSRADAERVPVYTDTNSGENVPLYEHFGFRCMEESHVTGTDVTVWALYRPAQQHTAA